MVELRKVIVFLVVMSIFLYMIWLNFKILNKYSNKKFLTALMISGLGLISAATFLDVISELTNIKFNNMISICFTAGAILFGAYIVLWSRYVVKIIASLHKKANNDIMTGVYNRSGFRKNLKQVEVKKTTFYIMVFDLDKTKVINDNFGHLKGDQYIIEAAKIIQEEIGKVGFVGRTGGDEFIACVEKVSEEEVRKIISSIKKKVTNIFKYHDTKISIGYSRAWKDAWSSDDLIKMADKRMYEDKKSKRGYLENKTNR